MGIYDIHGEKLSGGNGSNVFWQNNHNTPYWILHLDCGRKYFTVANVKTLIDDIADAGFNQMQLHISDNEGFRLELDDMTVVTDNQNVYDLTSALGGSENPTMWYSQDDMDEIIDYAHLRGIDIVPSIDMPAHMRRLMSAMSITGNNLDVTDANQVSFAKKVVDKFAEYFSSRGCRFYNLGFDEFSEGTLYNNGKYGNVTSLANALTAIVKSYGMTPRMWNDGIHYNNDFDYYFDRDIEIYYWAPKSASFDTFKHMGYSIVNFRVNLYWVSNGLKVTAETIANANLLDGETKGATFPVWCDYSASASDNGDGGDAIVSAIEPLIQVFGENLMSI